ncbi:hypothetical protein [Chthonobacter rhizosphaerae]|uniref:hypothetical protein n=1 Tax=Chthonobacter rhizosphaerae TaxID=2735553 RepID=UPI0015EE8007|nr:hypothetical protein [Chthonobacter rhizosphaerae]
MTDDGAGSADRDVQAGNPGVGADRGGQDGKGGGARPDPAAAIDFKTVLLGFVPDRSFGADPGQSEPGHFERGHFEQGRIDKDGDKRGQAPPGDPPGADDTDAGRDDPAPRAPPPLVPPAVEIVSPALTRAAVAIRTAWRDHLTPLIDLIDANAASPAPSAEDDDAIRPSDAEPGEWGQLEDNPIERLVDEIRDRYAVAGEMVLTDGGHTRLGAFTLGLQGPGFRAEITHAEHVYDRLFRATVTEGAGPVKPITLSRAIRIADQADGETGF